MLAVIGEGGQSKGSGLVKVDKRNGEELSTMVIGSETQAWTVLWLYEIDVNIYFFLVVDSVQFFCTRMERRRVEADPAINLIGCH